MIQKETILVIADNSGAKFIKCFYIYKKRKVALLDTTIKGSVISLRNKRRKVSKVKRGQKIKALILQTTLWHKRLNGFLIKNFKNKAILLTGRKEPLGSRLFCGIPKELRRYRLAKLIALSAYNY